MGMHYEEDPFIMGVFYIEGCFKVSTFTNL